MRRKLGQCQRRVRRGLPAYPSPSSPAKPHRFGVFQYAMAKRITGENFTEDIDTDPTPDSLRSAYRYEGDDE